MIVKFFATYRDITKCKDTALPATEDVLDLMRQLSRQFGPVFRRQVLNAAGDGLNSDVIIMVNGRHIDHLQGVRTKLNEEDTVAVFPMVAGG